MTGPPTERSAFVERIRLQLRARYRDVTVDAEPDRFALHLRGPSVDTTLPLAPLHHAVLREPARTAALITEFVASVERQLSPQVPSTAVRPSRLLWCVRTDRYLQGLSRAGSLLTAGLPGGLVAFVAEELPGSIMRGVPREDWEASGMDDSAVRSAAASNTEARFAGLARRVRAADRVPADGWRMSADPLFQSSVLMVPALLGTFSDRVGGEVLLGVPDRGVALAVAASAEVARPFMQRVTREYREAMNPVSQAVLRTDGTSLWEEPRSRRDRAGAAVMPWLQE